MKQKALAKRLAALTAAVMALTVFSGCADKQPEQKPAETTTTAPAETEAPVKVTLPPKTTVSRAEADRNALLGEDIPCTPAVWKVTSPKGNEMYMMGSMHALNKTCYPLPDYVMNAYENCDILAVECDITDIMSGAGTQLKYADKMTYPEGGKLEEHISEETWENLIGYLDYYNIKPTKYENNTAWVVYASLQSVSLKGTGLTADRGVDGYLLDSAHRDNKEIHEVESVDSQLTMLMEFPDEMYDILLATYSADSAEALAQQNLDTFRAWKTGDVEWIEKEAVADFPEGEGVEKALVDEYYSKMYVERNAHMENDAKELIDSSKNVFFVVGLAHFVGDIGIISLLEKDGYTVERVNTDKESA